MVITTCSLDLEFKSLLEESKKLSRETEIKSDAIKKQVKKIKEKGKDIDRRIRLLL